MQRGWIKGRNECWKADDLRQCVLTNYQQRITELQIKGGQMMVPSPVIYQCGTVQVSAYFYADTELPSAVINQDANPPLLAYGVSSGSGARYEGQDLSFWNKGDEGVLSRYGEEDIRCTVRK